MAKQNNIDLKGQPQSLEAEQAVLGSMLTSKEAVAKALQWLKPNMFYKDAHAKIASSMVDLFEKGEPIDAVSVVNLLKKRDELKGVGGAYYISGLAESVPTTANIEHYSKIVLEKSILRTLIQVSHEVSKKYRYHLFGWFYASFRLKICKAVAIAINQYSSILSSSFQRFKCSGSGHKG